VRRVARHYADRYETLVEAIDRRLSHWLRPIPAAAGLHVAAEVVRGSRVDISRVTRRAWERGVRVAPLSAFYLHPPARAGLAIGYGAIPASRIDEGIKRLAASFAE